MRHAPRRGEAYNYEYYLSLCEIEGLFLTEGSKLSIVRKFTEALKNAKDEPATMTWLYFKMPDFVFLQRNKNLLIDDLTGILKGNVNEDAIHTEATVLKILQAFVTDNKADQDNLLYELTTSVIEKQTLFEVLYIKMNDAFGADNWTAAIQLLYKIWSASSYADENKYQYTGQPERLAYQSEKILGFYNSGFDFSFEQNKIEVKRDRETPIGEGQTSTEKVHYTSYGYFQQIVLQEIEQDGELKIPFKIPAFYLKAFDDKNKWYNYDKTAWVIADIALTFTAVGNLAKLRYLTYLSKTAMYVRLTYGSIILASSLTQTMLNFVNDCSGGSFCEKLKTYLFWLDLATISLDAITERMLRKSAREALDAVDSKIPREIREHLEEVAKNINSIRLTKLELKEWIAEIRKLGGDVKFYTESKEMVKYFKSKNVGAAFEGKKIPPTIWIRKDVSDLEMFHESMHFEDFLRRGKESYLRGTKRELLPFGNKPPIPEYDLLISKYIKEKYVLEKILEEQATWMTKYGKGRFTDQEISFSKDYFNETINKCLEEGIDVSKIKLKP